MIKQIRADNLRKSYGREFELNCSLEIQCGRTYAMVGPNGSGKSTLLRILALLEHPDTGTVIYQNEGGVVREPFRDLALRRTAVIVPTRAYLFNDTVFNNLAYGLRIRGFMRSEIRERVSKALRDTGLIEKKGHNARELSSGEAQRLCIGRAFAIDPDVLLLDEPTSSLDPYNTRVVEDLILKWREDKDGILIIVTHSLFQARRVSDDIVFMYGGKVIETAATGSFFTSPSTELGRQFVEGKIY